MLLSVLRRTWLGKRPKAAAPPVQRPLERLWHAFHEQYPVQNYGLAGQALREALLLDPAATFRHFITHHGPPMGRVLLLLGMTDEVAGVLDRAFSTDSSINLACDNDPDEVSRLMALRNENLQKGLPSIVLVTHGKSGSVSIGGLFHSGFNLPSVAYSLLTQRVIPSWTRDFARGGACFSTHLDPSGENVALLKANGIDHLIVHVRDPRQIMVSLIHHHVRYAEQKPEHNTEMFQAMRFIDKADQVIATYYPFFITWIEGWVQAAEKINILFSTFEDFVRDRDAFVDRYLDFYRGDRRHFNLDNAIGMHAGTDYHFRNGQTDEWRGVLTPMQMRRLNDALPDALLDRFGWQR